jgi:hypothetical protein
MKRRVCDSCFFFESAGLNNSGWCRHPDRQFGAGMRLVVRGNEIACRNGWDADLWVSKDIDPTEVARGSDDPAAASPGADQITSIIPARYEPASPEPAPLVMRQAEDIVVGHAPYSGYTEPEKDARDLVTNPRAAILRAREQFKSRQKREGRIADLSDHPPLLVDATNDFPASDWDLPEDDSAEWADGPAENAPFLARGVYEAPRPQINIVPPVAREEIPRPYPTITSFAEDDERFESVPDLRPPARVANRTPAPIVEDEYPVAMAMDADHHDDLQVFDDDHLWQDDVYVDHRPRRESIVNRLLRERRERRATASQHHPVHDDWYDDIVEELPQYDAAPDRAASRPVHSHEEPRFEAPYRPAAPRAQDPIASYDDIVDDVLVEDRPVRREVEAPPPSRTDRWDDERPVAASPAASNGRWDDDDYHYPASVRESYEEPSSERWIDDELPRWDDLPVRTAAIPDPQPGPPPRPFNEDIPRICRTCRDYRPSELPDRGWCNNAWAFRHRRMVDADTLSCGTSALGSWWTANDGVWQKPSDVSRHAQETPLLDRLLASRYDQIEGQRRAGGSSGR